ncbi:2-C-methyl-D-erythritol 2,4-cyclodiphosphate synthase [Tenuifilum thalassicum]|uniref:2-C-methyl-D-erythritol 2,4-cyclodiphosphate synthase n=1 Tax=Tenuifilum thalassicum TaxID=2590900 RepID=A0A7D3XK48_9BACT|nr:2-C-methyl-D-erythritol 2,4-cyclodiphosphate synthase [Tenuifilum thalassicum]QKG79490.1 2-C-methyl-D-erythritol 2,4-cyclodiphosphate synthase [Tenuifilum thalassicum]
MEFRVGFGYDVHQLKEGIPFWLGGIKIEHTKGSLGHSDGDALIHAICDALLGAANLGDIGLHFPDTDPTLKGIDSKLLLKKCVELIKKEGYGIGNIDTTICLQKPKVKELIPKMRESLAEVMGIDQSQVSIKATTTEKLGFVGKEKGLAAYAVVLIKKI